VLDIEKYMDKRVRVKFSGGREGARPRTGRRAGRRLCGVGSPRLFFIPRTLLSPARLRAVTGVLKGFDPLLNLVLDETIEFLRGAYRAD
jgi:hypothetical protein